MKNLALSFLTCLALSAAPFSSAAIRRETCSCTADDHSCQASISCRGGCIAYCPSGGCRAKCLKGKPGSESAQAGTPRPKGDYSLEDAAKMPTPADIEDEAEAAHRREVRRVFLKGGRMSVCFRNVSAGQLADDLSSVTGLRVRAEPARASTLINYSGKRVTFDEILTQLSKSSDVRFWVE